MQVYVKRDAVGEKTFQDFRLAAGVTSSVSRGRSAPRRTADHRGDLAAHSGEVAVPLPEVAWLEGCPGALSPPAISI
jgi:hypothetical protein